MGTEDWRPLSVREGRGGPNFDGPYDGIPPWLKRPLMDWVGGLLDAPYHFGESGIDRADVLKLIQRKIRVELDWSEWVRSASESLMALTLTDEMKFLDAVDYLLSRLNRYSPEIGKLYEILGDGSLYSVSRVGDDSFRLTRRVAPGVQELVERTTEAAPEAGHFLLLAWQEVYGREKNANSAFDHAVKAVETAAHDVVIPDEPKPTLGKIIRAMKDKPEKWEAVLGAAKQTDNVPRVIEMMELLWTANVRHSKAGGVEEVDEDEAAAALHLAATLVQWFGTGAVRLREG